MRALWLEEQQLRLREDLEIPEPPSGEVRVRVLRAGICNTDLELLRGYYPYAGIPGHEFVGVVDAGPSRLLGQRVVGEINAACSACAACRAERRTHCEKRTVLGIVGRNGAFAEYLLLPEENLHVVPEEVGTDAATFTEPLAAALEIQEQITIDANERVLVVGDGKLGQLIAQTLALTSCDLTVVARHPRKAKLLLRRGIRALQAVEPGSFDIAVECTGNPEGFTLAQRALRARGTLVMKSTYAGSLPVDVAAVVVNELTLVGSRCGPFVPALRLLATREVEVEPLIDARYALTDALAAFAHAQRRGVLKVLVDVADP
ncbi:MAG: alcohol dehydrogenase catalytic domain-containing protein [Candidatus Latescibacterota bacterium]|nr:MAG: alcohol dehydrogenase catalytic domain-containing protein [Candidatus Latescibacterota bacterium]